MYCYSLILFSHTYRPTALQLLAKMIDELLTSYRELRLYLTSRLRNPDDAADIAQSSFERVYAHAMPVAGTPTMHIQSPRALLFRTANNICIDIARHKRVAAEWLRERSEINSEIQAESSFLSAQDQLEHRQLIEQVALLLDQLPQRRREVFLLFKVYGYSRTEIAARLHITEAAVAKHVVRATISCSKVFAELQRLHPTASKPTSHDSYTISANQYAGV